MTRKEAYNYIIINEYDFSNHYLDNDVYKIIDNIMGD